MPTSGLPFSEAHWVAHLARQHQIAFQPRDAEILVAGGDDKECINVRGDHLLFACIGRCTPFEQVQPTKDACRLQRVLVDKQPVADCRMIVRGSGIGNMGCNRVL